MPSDPDLPLLSRRYPSPALPHLACLATFVARTRAVVETPALSAADRAALLTDLGRRLDSPAVAANQWADTVPLAAAAIAAADDLGRSISATQVPRQHLRHFLQACARETHGWTPATWSDLLVHGRFAAASLGRHGLAVVGGAPGPAGMRALDALAIAVWLLRQVRAIEPTPLRQPPRCIPSRFFADAMITPAHLRLASARGQSRAVLDRVLDGVDHLLLEAAPLPDSLPTVGLARHAALLLCRSRALAARLRRQDPLLQPVRLGAWQRGRCALVSFATYRFR